MVVEDAPSGIAAARAGGMLALGIARLDDAALLVAAGADLVVTDLGRIDVRAVASGVLRPGTAGGTGRTCATSWN